MSTLYPTAHINATPADIAETVLMPGDPLRAKLIAEKFLDGAVLFNNVRGVQGYTGTYKGKRVSVMASGMGVPSIAIYSHELFNVFGVENIIRVGSAGGYSENVHVRDIVIGMGACTNSAYPAHFGLAGSYAPIADFGLLRTAAEMCEELGARYHVGNLLTTDSYYANDPSAAEAWRRMGVLAVEMEAAGLYMNAAKAGKKALTICTVSDHLFTGEETNADERQNSFTEMIRISLETAIRI